MSRSVGGARLRIDPGMTTEVVTFTTPEGVECSSAGLVGDFTAWAPLAMHRNADGTHSASIRLDQARRWRYQFLLDGDRLINDWSADDFVTLADGRCASVVST